MRYLCLVYGEEKTLAAMDELGVGRCIVAHRLEPARSAATVRVRSGKVLVGGGPGADTQPPLIGFCLIEARDLNDAISAVAQMPAARSGNIDVRPVQRLS